MMILRPEVVIIHHPNNADDDDDDVNLNISHTHTHTYAFFKKNVVTFFSFSLYFFGKLKKNNDKNKCHLRN